VLRSWPVMSVCCWGQEYFEPYHHTPYASMALYVVILKVLTLLLWKIQVFWDVAPCWFVNSYLTVCRSLLSPSSEFSWTSLMLNMEAANSWNFSSYLWIRMTLYPRGL
jgi:hypothetical protein